MKTLSIIGAGKVGKTLGKLLQQNSCCRIQDVLCRTKSHAWDAVAFIGAGKAITDYQELLAVDIVMLAVNDDQLQEAILSLKSLEIMDSCQIVFHCSGSFSHEILLPLKQDALSLASLHPIKSFSHPERDYQHFKNTFCTLQGELLACQALKSLLSPLDAQIIEIDASQKMLLHIAAIFSSNYFVALVDTSLQLLEKTGINSTLGFSLLSPLIKGAFQQIENFGTIDALTGPIARGEIELIKQQIEMLKNEAPHLVALYKILGERTLDVANAKHLKSSSLIESFQALLCP